MCLWPRRSTQRIVGDSGAQIRTQKKTAGANELYAEAGLQTATCSGLAILGGTLSELTKVILDFAMTNGADENDGEGGCFLLPASYVLVVYWHDFPASSVQGGLWRQTLVEPSSLPLT